jgi:hypothetical protein
LSHEYLIFKVNKKMKKMKKIVFVLIAMFIAVNVGASQDDGAAVLVVSEDTHDFGTIKESDGKVSHTFVVKNEGTKPLTITRVVPSCGCTSSGFTEAPIAPGKTGEIHVTYDPQGHPGPFTKTVSVYSNGKAGSQVLIIRGNVN